MNKKNSPIDEQIEKINQQLAKILGKKDNNNLDNNLSSSKFILLLIINLLLLWCITGFYFVGSNQYAIFYKNGKMIDIIKGVKIGFTYPIPFGDYQLINANLGDTLSINTNRKEWKLSKDLKPLKVTVIFNYKINNIKKFYENFGFVQDTNKLIFLLFNMQLREYIASKDSNVLVHNSLIAQGNEFRDTLNKQFEVYGINISKLYFEMLTVIDNDDNFKEKNDIIKKYKQELKLLNLAIKKDKNIAKNELNANKYPLLTLDLEGLKNILESNTLNTESGNHRNLDRVVIRERVFR